MGAYKHARYASVEIAFDKIGDSYAATLLLGAHVLVGDAAGVIVLNSLDDKVVLSLNEDDAGTPEDFAILEAGEPIFFNAFAMGNLIHAGAISAY